MNFWDQISMADFLTYMENLDEILKYNEQMHFLSYYCMKVDHLIQPFQ